MSLPLRSHCLRSGLGQPLIVSIVAASAILTLLVPVSPSLAKQVQAISSKSAPQNGVGQQQQQQVMPSQAPSMQQVAAPAQGSGAGSQSATSVAGQTDQQQQVRPVALVPNGAQLFQSPAALAAAATAAAAALASQNQLQVQSNGQFVQQQQQQANQAQQQQQTASIAANLISPSQLTNSLVSARVDTNELLKQAVQQSQLQQSQQQQVSSAASNYNIEQECVSSGGFISFELITGYVLSAQADSMIMQPGTLQLTDCLNLCRQNSSCLAINFENGLCVLLQESADKNPHALQKSQFPVFTIYAHKICVQGDRANRCHKSWSFERVIGWVLNNLEKKALMTKTRLECLLACYNEQAFQCRSFNYDSASGACSLSDMDRHSLPNASLRRRHYVESTVDTIDYGENNCIQEARGICDFKPVQNRILKTVDSIYQDIKTEPECRKRCLQAPYRCHSYDLGDISNPVCRTSHLDRNSLQQIQEPFLEIQGAISYELDSCYNVTVLCKSREMVARVKTNKIFNGKIYAKNAPLSCVNDVTNSMDFELPMAFNDACAIGRSGNNGMFSNEIVLQHNDMIVTNSDMGLNIKCQYDLRNQTVYNNINLDDFMSGREPIDIASQSAVVRSPNISMQILRQDGNHITQAQVGDSLLLRFQITDERSPFEIFVRDLYAMDGVGGAEIMLIDGEGCPTDPTIMAAMTNAKGNGQLLEAQFDAFKFPTSETVAFRGLVTPCIPHCEPVHCQNRVYDGTVYEAESYGKRRRRKRSALIGGATGAAGATSKAAPEEVVVRNSIEIKDKFFLDDEASSMADSADGAVGMSKLKMSAYETIGADGSDQLVGQRLSSLFGRLGQGYLRGGGLMLFFGVLLLAQSAMFVGWMFVSRKRSAAAMAANKLARSHLAQVNSHHLHRHQQQQQHNQFNNQQAINSSSNRYHV